MSDKQKAKIVGRVDVPVSKQVTASKGVYFFASEWNLLLSAAQIAHQNSFLKKTLHSLSNSKTGVHLVDIVSAPQEMYAYRALVCPYV